MNIITLRRISATRYVTPLREGGSLPALVEADDDGLYVLKFRGAGQGPKALVAEIVAGELARALGFNVPELALVELDPVLGRAEPDPEIQDLLARERRAQPRRRLPARLAAVQPRGGPRAPTPALAADIVWFDALVTNVDRTAQNPNLLLWHDRLWLIDHGAALYFHHARRPEPDHARGGVPGDPRARAASVRRVDRRGRRAARAARDAGAARGDRRAPFRPSGSTASTREVYVDVPARPARAAANVRRGGRESP